MNNENIIMDIKDLVVNYATENGIVQAVRNINLKLLKNRSLGLVGETGAGKTTTALSIMGLIPSPPGVIESGEIVLGNRNLLAMKENELEKIRGKEISMIFQDPMTSLNPVFTISHQIMESIVLHEKVNSSVAYGQALDMLQLVGIPRERANDYPHQLSGGMKQRVIIAIALACEPKILIADEPTTALDVTIQAQVLDLINELREKNNTSLIMITHDLGIVAEICDEVAVMYAGRIVEKGSLNDIFNNTKHPYTEGLFNSIPSIKARKSTLTPIPGMTPDPTKYSQGCAFAPRCKYVSQECKTTDPQELWLSESHMVACIAYKDPKFEISRRAK